MLFETAVQRDIALQRNKVIVEGIQEKRSCRCPGGQVLRVTMIQGRVRDVVGKAAQEEGIVTKNASRTGQD